MKILHIITDLSTGGAEMMLYNLLSRIDLSAFETRVISLTDIGSIGEKIQSMRLSVRALGMHPGVPNPLNILKLVSWLRQDRPHVIQTWMYHADLLGLLATRLIKMPKLVWSIRCSNVPFDKYRPRTGWIVKLCSHLSVFPDAIIINSRAGIRQHVQLGYTPRRMQLISNGIDLKRFHPDNEARPHVRRELGLSEDTLIIGLVARWDPLKDHSTFIQAASLIAREHKDTYFFLIGEGMKWETQELASLISDAGLQDKIFLLGQRDDIPRLTAAFDIACSSSITEGFPTTVGEAMSCGVPCVVTNVGDSAFIVGDTGLVAPPRDPTAMAKAWAQILTMSEEDRLALGRSARKRVASHFSIDRVTRQYEKLYDELVAKVRKS